MGLVKGNPVMLVTLFFGAAVLSMGGLYALLPSILHGPTLGQMAVAVALGISLVFSVLVIGRIFWVISRTSRKASS